jgi:hypothetical protein
MPRTVGINPGYLAKLDQSQRDFLITAVGIRFFDEFLTQYGKHLFIFGTTGSGKTNKGYAFVDWLKHLETQIWFDSGKQNEILPLLCMDRKVRIIVPSGTDIIIEEHKNGWQKIQNHPEVIQVSTPQDALSGIAVGSWGYQIGLKNHDIYRDTATIISFRNAFSKKEMAVEWIAEFFEGLAERCRSNTMPNIFPASVHIDESQWAIAGKRVSGEGARTKASEVITENAMELRSAKVRLILYAQGYTNIPPAARENMLFNVMCHGGIVSSDENGNLSKWCSTNYNDFLNPRKFSPKQGRFVFEDGNSYPFKKPWSFRLYPKEESDRRWIGTLRVRYVGKHDIGTEEREIETECFPELGRFQALAIKPEVQEMAESRWNMPPGEIVND